ncbi:hypothetical protein GCM10027317_22210 [Massilia agri]
MFLDDESQRIEPGRAAFKRFGRDIEIALGFIEFERVWHGPSRLWVWEKSRPIEVSATVRQLTVLSDL